MMNDTGAQEHPAEPRRQWRGHKGARSLRRPPDVAAPVTARNDASKTLEANGNVGSGLGTELPCAARQVPEPGDAWMHHMRRGDFAPAWAVSDAAVRARAGVPCWRWPRHLQYIWDGRPLRGRRVLVRCYHGLGDTIQFIRYMPLLREIAREVIVWAQPVLLPLLRSVAGIDQLLPLHDGVPEVNYDVDVELMELPHVFRTTLETVPRTVPYLFLSDGNPSLLEPAIPGGLPPDRSSPGRAAVPKTCRTCDKLLAGAGQAAGSLRVGVAWRGGDWNERRDLPASLLPRLAEVPGVEWHVLQERRRGHEWPAGRGVLDCPEPVEQLARTIQMMDLVITVDSLPAHLAGALAVPVWTLLPFEADWRWMQEREDSPWYPTMQLWRQQRPGEWESVIERVRAELARLVRASGTRQS